MRCMCWIEPSGQGNPRRDAAFRAGRVNSGTRSNRLRQGAMKQFRKRDFPLDSIRRFLEPGPIVLVSSAWKGETNIMTMGWHMMMGFEPALFGCYIWEGNHSHGLIKRSRECVINLPT